MGRLVSITETKLNFIPVTARTVLLNTLKVVQVTQDTDVTQSIIRYDKLDGTDPDIIRASGLPSQITTALNTGNNAVNSISVTEVSLSGVTTVRKLNPLYIYRVWADPADANKSYVQYRDEVMTQFFNYHCTNTVAAILSAANA